MQLCLFRHGDAGDRAEFAKTGQPDDLRPLSDDGREEVMLAAQGLHELLGSCDLLATSPLTRARQTAEIIAGVFSCGQVDVTSVLVPGHTYEEFVVWAKSHASSGAIICVGHEPHLGELASWLTDESDVELKKGGACLIEFEGGVAPDAGRLVWNKGPKKLAKELKTG